MLPRLILGSASPRRSELLKQLGATFEVRAADIDETPGDGEDPRSYVQRMAREKAEALPREEGEILLTADTTVILDDRSLGKPECADHAREMLHALSARDHSVCTAVAVLDEEGQGSVSVETVVTFIELTDTMINQYLETDEPWDKAGAYGIQGLAGSFVRRVQGSVSNVIGLPQAETRELLAARGMRLGVSPWSR